MAAWCAACLFRLDPICAIQGTAFVGRQVYLGAVIGLAGGSKSLGVSSRLADQRLVGQPYMQLGIRGLPGICKSLWWLSVTNCKMGHYHIVMSKR